MITILVDHNIECQAALLWGTLASEGWLELTGIQLSTFRDVGLPVESTDRVVWRFSQACGMLLLTDNRSMEGADSLEQTMRDEGEASSLSVLTIGSTDRLRERVYRVACATRLVEVVLDFEVYHGTRRLFIP
jgi:hypothetical protein